MGIPGFNTWFRQHNHTAHVPLKGVRLDHIYIDMNSVLHLVLRKARSMDHFHAMMFAKLDGILMITKPTKSVLLALDGPAPLAKLLTQRSRRKKMSMTTAQAKGKVVPAIAITPGTPFMQEVHDSLQYYICQRLIGHKFGHLQMELSGATVKGEGEVKILSRLQRPLSNVSPDDTHAMIGNDSDLFVMALLSEAKHLHVLSQILATVSMPKPEHVQIFSVDKLHEAWRKFGPPPEADRKLEAERLRGLKQDLAVTCILGRGNDYLPGVGGISLSRSAGKPTSKWDEGLWQIYLSLRKSPQYRYRSLTRKNKKNRTELDCEFMGVLLEEASKGKHFGPREKLNANVKAAEPDQYLDGLCWVMDMYHGGVCPDYRFLYDGMGPSVKEVLDEIKERKTKGVKSQGDGVPGPGKRRKAGAVVEGGDRGGGQPSDLPPTTIEPLSPAACALALLPKEGQFVVPKPLQHLMDAGSPIIDMYIECKTCAALSQRASEVSAAATEISRKKLELSERISILERTSPRQAEALQATMEKLTKEGEVLKVQTRENNQRREQHMNDDHPYTPFPVHRIEQAVQSVPLKNFSEKERELIQFGTNFIYKRMEKPGSMGPPAAAGQQGKGANWKAWKQHKRNQLSRVTSPPSPPSSKFQRLRGPLPIQRSLLAGDEAGRIFGRLARNVLKMAKSKL
ncbi:hypothetical protein BSKO_03249 [Bryopsis sp. KO-2023]|nr:hypothetical protein BSKO_03249 [Bryopsis sp. KO-2023]